MCRCDLFGLLFFLHRIYSGRLVHCNINLGVGWLVRVMVGSILVGLWLGRILMGFVALNLTLAMRKPPYAKTQRYSGSPVILVEVISRSSRKTDEQTKRLEYINIPSLEEFVLIAGSTLAILLSVICQHTDPASPYAGQSRCSP
jgi:hypothetical protein